MHSIRICTQPRHTPYLKYAHPLMTSPHVHGRVLRVSLFCRHVFSRNPPNAYFLCLMVLWLELEYEILDPADMRSPLWQRGGPKLCKLPLGIVIGTKMSYNPVQNPAKPILHSIGIAMTRD